jgi:hypothetical protein
VKVDGKGLVIKTPLASLTGYLQHQKSYSNRKGLISSNKVVSKFDVLN